MIVYVAIPRLGLIGYFDLLRSPYNITLMNIIGMNHIWLRNGIYPCRQLTLIVSFHTSLKDGWDEYLIEQRPSISKDAGLW